MPLLEVLVVRDKPLTREERESLKQEAEAVFQEVLGTPPGRLRVIVVEDLDDAKDPSLL
ncbi:MULTISPECIES: hypothetical protein [Thermus]|uniref:4-oxalocrotonate tautomerase n=1 Tax=Thermus scotoductus (strain ATCC 700910 / SA-01) TaxID=743525 RepID=E8PQC3_THESS|nr:MULTISPECIES: hypothetical protein [Thermus]ADW21782.1 conserved hypothetical protein [Thermus scotoductus SA-01]